MATSASSLSQQTAPVTYLGNARRAFSHSNAPSKQHRGGKLCSPQVHLMVIDGKKLGARIYHLRSFRSRLRYVKSRVPLPSPFPLPFVPSSYDILTTDRSMNRFVLTFRTSNVCLFLQRINFDANAYLRFVVEDCQWPGKDCADSDLHRYFQIISIRCIGNLS